MGEQAQKNTNRAGQRVALLIAGIGVAWIALNFAGSALEWSNRTRALFDLMALAGFAYALWQTINLWRARRNDKG